jgi:hypothetical protein
MMGAGLAYAGLLERVQVRPCGKDRALVSVALPSVHLAGMWARRDAAGRVRIEAPLAYDDRPAYALQPHFRAAVTDAVRVLWARADGEAAAPQTRDGRTVH